MLPSSLADVSAQIPLIALHCLSQRLRAAALHGFAEVGTGTEDEIRMLPTSVNGMCSCPLSEAAKEAGYKEPAPTEQEAASSPHTFVLLGCETIRLTSERTRSRRRTLAGGFRGEAAEAERSQENSTPDQQADTVYKIVDVVGVSETSVPI